jgi:molecular chaperone GrpE
MEAKEKNPKDTVKEEIKAEKGQAPKEKTEGKSTAKSKSAVTKKKTTGSSLAKTKKKLEESQLQLAEMQDKYLRLTAEFDNYRKRTLKEKMDLVKTGGEQVILNLLPILDNLERAMASIRDARDYDALKEGLELIYGKFQEFLGQNGVKEVEAIDTEFDTDVHEAITKIPAPKPEMKGKVVDVVERGYYLHDKVVRFAKVVVGE